MKIKQTTKLKWRFLFYAFTAYSAFRNCFDDLRFFSGKGSEGSWLGLTEQPTKWTLLAALIHLLFAISFTNNALNFLNLREPLTDAGSGDTESTPEQSGVSP
jgi:hypothetical protein